MVELFRWSRGPFLTLNVVCWHFIKRRSGRRKGKRKGEEEEEKEEEEEAVLFAVLGDMSPWDCKRIVSPSDMQLSISIFSTFPSFTLQ